MKKNTRHLAGITVGILSLAGYASAATLGSEKYTYDASGNIIEKSIDGVVTKMAYDQSNRLTEFQTAGQAKQTTAYDAAGRPVAERNADGQTTRCLSYGYADKVLETQTQDTKAGFYYNAAGQLVGKQTHAGVSTYTWDGNVLAAENADPFANEAHISGGVPVLVSGTEVVVSDHLGNTLAYGAKQFTSTAYGDGLEQGRFCGKPYVKEIRAYVFHYRNYSLETNRWTAADPSGFPNGINSSTYVNNDPLTRVDSEGLDFMIFNNDKLKGWSGSGYTTAQENGHTVGSVDIGTHGTLPEYDAFSNNNNQTAQYGRSPNGWYTIGTTTVSTAGIAVEGDSLAGATWSQGYMSQWGKMSGGVAVQDLAVTRSNDDYQQATIFLKEQWKVAYGANFIPGNLAPGQRIPFVKYDASNGYTRIYNTLKIHPDGQERETQGCIGIRLYVDCVDFRNKLTTWGGRQLLVTEP